MINVDRPSLWSGLKYGIFSSLWPFPLIFLLRWPNELMNSLNCACTSPKPTHLLELTKGDKPDVRKGGGGEGGGMRGRNKALSEEQKEHGRTGGREGENIIFLPRLSTWTLACASSKSSYLSAHPDERAGWRRVMNVRCLHAARSSQLGRVSGRRTDWLIIYTGPISGEWSRLCPFESK